MRAFVLIAIGLGACSAPACDLCAIYNARDASGQSGSGIIGGISELFVPYRTLQVGGEDVKGDDLDYLHSSITHLFGTYNFSERFGLSLNIPYVYNSFKRSEVRFFPDAPPVFNTERGSKSGIGDMALVGRIGIWQKRTMKYAFSLNVLGGVKFPTGDTSRIKDEVEQVRIYQELVGPVPHDPLGHTVSGVHQHRISPGSGSFDGVTGFTLNANWKRWFFNTQFQYYIRTEGESSFRYGDDLMLSGGPGYYLLLKDSLSLSLQGNFQYESEQRDEVDGTPSDFTGMNAWYGGPLINLTVGEHFSMNVGADIPLNIASRGVQNVPDYRVHGGVSWRF